LDSGALTILIACLAFSTLLSTLHLALSDLSRTALEGLAQQRRARRRKLARIHAITADVAGHGRAVALVRIVCNLAMVIAAVRVVATVRGTSGLGWTDGLAAVVITALLVWLCNVVLAESLAKHVGEKLVYAFSILTRVVYLMQRPFSPVSHIVDSLVRGITGTRTMNRAESIEQDLLEVMEEGERQGQIDEAERKMIEAVVNFKSSTVEQIMTPRNEIEALQLTNNLGTITAFVRKARHSRIPVYKESLDDIVGFFYVKDLLRWLAGEGPRGKGGGFDLRAILRPAMLVPETKTIRGLAEEFVARKIHVAVVADEYGGTAGIVSLEDIVEEVFGDIQDEYEKPEDDPPKIEVKPEGRMAEIDARAYIGAVNDALEPLGVEVPESDEYDTLGGFVLSTMGRIPAQNESFSHGPMIVTVLEATPTRVVRVRILVKPDEAEGHAPEIVTESRVGEAERMA